MYAGTNRRLREFVSLANINEILSEKGIIPPLLEVLMIDSDTNCDYSDNEAIERIKRVINLKVLLQFGNCDI